MKIFFLLFALSCFCSCGISKKTIREKYNTQIIERVDTVVTIRPMKYRATFDSITTTRQTIQTPSGTISAQRFENGSTEIICETDTVFVDVFIDRVTTTQGTKKNTTIENRGVRGRWFIFGLIAAVILRMLLPSILLFRRI